MKRVTFAARVCPASMDVALRPTLSSRPEKGTVEIIVPTGASVLGVEVDVPWEVVDIEVLVCRPEFTAR